MPTLTPQPLALTPSDTSIPGLARRRMWKAPELVSHSLLVLTLPRLYLTPNTGEPRADVLAALETAPLVDNVLGPFAIAIDLASIRRVKLDLTTNTLCLTHTTANAKQVDTTIVFATTEPADAVFTKLWRRLGTGFELVTDRHDVWELARVPLAFMAAVFVFTSVAAVLLNALADSGGPTGATASVWPNWKLVCGVGGGLVAAAQVWLYRRLTRPPEQLVLRPV